MTRSTGALLALPLVLSVSALAGCREQTSEDTPIARSIPWTGKGECVSQFT